MGIHVPDYAVVSSLGQASELISNNELLVIKPMNELSGYIFDAEAQKGSHTRAAGFSRGASLAAGDERQPVPIFIQQAIRKSYDLRVVVIGSKVFPIAIRTHEDGTQIDIRSQWTKAKHELVSIDTATEAIILDCQRTYGLNYGAFDFAVDAEGKLWFLECNPLGQFAWIDLMAGTNLCKEMVLLLVGESEPLVRN